MRLEKEDSKTIWSINTDKTGLQQFIEGYVSKWSPDGRYIAFLRSPQEQAYELWVMGVESTN